MKSSFLLASATALASVAAPAAAQHEHMPGMTMPAPVSPAPDQAAQVPDHSQMDHSKMKALQTDKAEHGEHHRHEMAMTGALGPYSMGREASGTAWQPDASEHSGIHAMRGDWTVMAHAVLNLVYDHQSGPRGDERAFASGMLMGMARRALGNGALQFKAMLSPDPLMGKRGYPVADFERRAADISVDHSAVVENYRAAQAIALRDQRGEADTEELRKAVVHYRALFDELLEVKVVKPEAARAHELAAQS